MRPEPDSGSPRSGELRVLRKRARAGLRLDREGEARPLLPRRQEPRRRGLDFLPSRPAAARNRPNRGSLPGEPAGVVQLLDRHARDCAEVASALGVPHYAVPVQGVTASPLEIVPLARSRFWKEVAAWIAGLRALVVADALGTVGYFRAPGEQLGVHPLFRFRPPRTLARDEPRHILCGHGAEPRQGGPCGAPGGAQNRASPPPQGLARRNQTGLVEQPPGLLSEDCLVRLVPVIVNLVGLRRSLAVDGHGSLSRDWECPLPHRGGGGRKSVRGSIRSLLSGFRLGGDPRAWFCDWSARSGRGTGRMVSLLGIVYRGGKSPRLHARIAEPGDVRRCSRRSFVSSWSDPASSYRLAFWPCKANPACKLPITALGRSRGSGERGSSVYALIQPKIRTEYDIWRDARSSATSGDNTER